MTDVVFPVDIVSIVTGVVVALGTVFVFIYGLRIGQALIRRYVADVEHQRLMMHDDSYRDSFERNRR